jgi:hypothetical protein
LLISNPKPALAPVTTAVFLDITIFGLNYSVYSYIGAGRYWISGFCIMVKAYSVSWDMTSKIGATLKNNRHQNPVIASLAWLSIETKQELQQSFDDVRERLHQWTDRRKFLVILSFEIVKTVVLKAQQALRFAGIRPVRVQRHLTEV